MGFGAEEEVDAVITIRMKVKPDSMYRKDGIVNTEMLGDNALYVLGREDRKATVDVELLDPRGNPTASSSNP